MLNSISISNKLDQGIEENHLLDFLDRVSWQKIGMFGGRKLVYQGCSGTLSMNELVKKVSSTSSLISKVELFDALERIKYLDKEGNDLLSHSSFVKKILTCVKRFFGNLNFDRHHCLNRLEVNSSKEVNDLTEIDDLKQYCQSNPFIHGTSSVIFALLPKTGQKLVSIWELLKNKMAPIGGEIFLGGTNGLMVEGESCFGRLAESDYSLSRVLKNYSQRPASRDINNGPEEQDHLQSDFIYAYNSYYFTQCLIIATRAKQRGLDLISADKKEAFKKDIIETKTYLSNLYLMVPFLAKFVRMNDDSIKKSFKFEQFTEDFRQFLNGENDTGKPIDLSPFVYKDTLPRDDEIIKKIKAFIESKGLQLLEKKPEITQTNQFFDQFEADLEGSSFTIDNLLSLQPYALKYPSRFLDSLDSALKILNPILNKIEAHFNLFEQMLFGKEDLSFTEEQKKYIDDPYPILLISNQKSGFKPVKSEHRATQALELGKDIKYIATDDKYLHEVRAYLRKYGMKDVKVVSFKTLKTHTVNS